MKTNPDLLRPHEAANFLGLTEATLRLWRCEGRSRLGHAKVALPYVKIGGIRKGAGRVYYRKADLEAFVAARVIRPGESTPPLAPEQRKPKKAHHRLPAPKSKQLPAPKREGRAA